MKPEIHLDVPGGVKNVLLHCCCAPCSSAIVECLLDNGVCPTLFFCNPNIYPREEYERRKAECIRHAGRLGLDFVDADMVDMQTEYGVRQVASISFQDLKSLPPEKRRLIQSIKIDRSGSPVVELMDKSKAIETINRMLGYNAPEKTANTDTKGNDLPQPTFNTDRFFQLIQMSRSDD